MARRPAFVKKIEHRIEYRAVRALIWITSVVPQRTMRRIGEGLGWTAFHVFRIRRRVVVDNITSCFPDHDASFVTHTAERSYMNWGRSLMEFAAQRHTSREDILGKVTIEGMENLDRAVEHGKGTILLTGHFGNWELLAAVVARSGYPLHVTDTNHTNKFVHNLINELRTCQEIRLISPQRPVGYLLRLLRENQFVAYLPDQNARGAGVFVDFFGRPAWTLRAPALFAIRRRCPTVPGFLIAEGNGRHRAVFGEPMWPDPRLKGEEAVVELTRRFAAILEDVIRESPSQYFWSHRRWKTQPKPGVAL